ncbi:Dimethylaniline monooxygenase [Platysternon megacephalum]|uniref:Dimethylaniline monooxygenase n=1 Tax=Platysternon megacephalum TaxID=55544 RepID=A0A4D9ECG4_9SAUR|nr:Dimethylaniline monooxygenase [Platysternon megacephalum]
MPTFLQQQEGSAPPGGGTLSSPSISPVPSPPPSSPYPIPFLLHTVPLPHFPIPFSSPYPISSFFLPHCLFPHTLLPCPSTVTHRLYRNRTHRRQWALGYWAVIFLACSPKQCFALVFFFPSGL